MKNLRKKIVSTPIVAVTGGKGGTGKSTVAVNLAAGLSAENLKVMLVDTDVDGPSCATLLGVRLEGGEEVRTFVPDIEASKCVGCKKCVEICPEHALVGLQGKIPKLYEELCSGCKACKMVCEYEAIKDGWKKIGAVYSSVVDGIKLVVGELRPTEPRSPVMARATVMKAIEELKGDGHDVAIFDTAPGVHNAVAQPLWVADLALAVTEPTPLGTHDLKFILDLARELELPAEVVLNKADVPGGLKDELINTCHERGVKLTAEIPLDEELLRSYIAGEPLIKKAPDSPAGKALMSLVSTLRDRLKGGEI